MVTKIAENIAFFFVRKGWGSNQKYEIYRYGCEVLLSAIISLFIVIICGFAFRMLNSALLFYIFFLILRRYCGGYHADTYLKCNLIFTETIVLVLWCVSKHEMIPNAILIIATVISFLIISCFSPIIHKDKPLNQAEIRLYQKIAISISGIDSASIAILLQYNRKIATILSLAMLVTAVAMLISLAKERGNKNEWECNRNAR